MAKNTRVKGTNFESLGFGFELPQSLMGTVGAVRVMRVEYDHYSKMCKSNKIPPVAAKDIPSYIEQLDCRLKDLEQAMYEKKVQQKRQQREQEALQRAKEEEERERIRLQKSYSLYLIPLTGNIHRIPLTLRCPLINIGY